MADLLSLKERSPIKISGIGGKISTAIRSTLKLSSVTSGFERLIEVFQTNRQYRLITILIFPGDCH